MKRDSKLCDYCKYMVIVPYEDYFACDFWISKYYVWFEHGYGQGYWKDEEVVETVPDECPYLLEHMLSVK